MGIIKPIFSERDNINAMLNEYRRKMNAKMEKKCMELKEQKCRDKQTEKTILV